jgi:hypothetical protein
MSCRTQNPPELLEAQQDHNHYLQTSSLQTIQQVAAHKVWTSNGWNP